MTATFDGARRTRLDPITLAAFEDSGWYGVNHSVAEELPWGQGENRGDWQSTVGAVRVGGGDFSATEVSLKP